MNMSFGSFPLKERKVGRGTEEMECLILVCAVSQIDHLNKDIVREVW